MKYDIEKIGKAAVTLSSFFQNLPKDLIKNKQDLLEIGTLGNELLKTFNEGKKLDIQGKIIDGHLRKLAYDFQQNQTIIEKVFKERSSVLELHFKAMDHALANNDSEGILNALKGASNIISSSPFENIEKVKLALRNNDETLYLDF